MNKLLEDIMRKRKIQTAMLLGVIVVNVVLVSILSFYYFTVIGN